jgi:hypothetical protein
MIALANRIHSVTKPPERLARLNNRERWRILLRDEWCRHSKDRNKKDRALHG